MSLQRFEQIRGAFHPKNKCVLLMVTSAIKFVFLEMLPLLMKEGLVIDHDTHCPVIANIRKTSPKNVALISS